MYRLVIFCCLIGVSFAQFPLFRQNNYFAQQQATAAQQAAAQAAAAQAAAAQTAAAQAAAAQQAALFRQPIYQRTAEGAAQILRQSSAQAPDGSSYQYNYETENGIKADQTGQVVQLAPDTFELQVQGQNEYVSPDGQIVKTVYIANKDGYQPQGSHIPVGPAIPPEILRSLDLIYSSQGLPNPYKK